MLNFDFQIVIADFRRTDTYLFEFGLVPFRLGFTVLFVVGVHPLAVVHNPAYRRISPRRDFDKVKPSLLCPFQRVPCVNDTDLFAIFVYQTY